MSLVDLYVNPLTGDLDLTSSQMRLTSNIEECVRQKVEITLKTYKGEYAFDIEAGVPYLENDNNPIQLLGKTSKVFFDTTIKSAISDVEGIVQIISYESVVSPAQGIISISFTATTKSGEIVSPISPIIFQV